MINRLILGGIALLFIPLSAWSAEMGQMQGAEREQERMQEREHQQEREEEHSRLREKERIYGWQLMTPAERRAYVKKMHQLKTRRAREAYRKQHHAQMQKRAEQRGIQLQDVPE